MKNFPNGFESWAETHHEVVNAIGLAEINENSTLLAEIRETQGTGGLWKFALELTDLFEETHKGKEWDGEWFETLEEFCEQAFKKGIIPLPEFSQEERKNIQELLSTMTTIQDKFASEIPSKETEWANDLYDQVQVSIGSTPDGDRQQEYFDKREFINYSEAREAIKHRIASLIKYI
jgi:hypothetical protein